MGADQESIPKVRWGLPKTDYRGQSIKDVLWRSEKEASDARTTYRFTDYKRGVK